MIAIATVVGGFFVCFVLFILLAFFPEKLLDHEAYINLDDRCEQQTHGTEGGKFHLAVTIYFLLSGSVYLCK